jgi:predicted MFS family arabinose efflux permease
MHNKKQIFVLIACCCIVASSIGILTNASGVFFTPIASDLGVGKGSVSMTLTIANIAYAIGGLLTVKLVHERNFKKMVLMLSAVYAVSTGLLSLCSSIILLYRLQMVGKVTL